MTTATETRMKVIVAPFGVEADHLRNADLLLQGVRRLRLRSALNANKPGYGKDAGVPVDQARRLNQLPPTPGMQIHVNPAACTYKVIDPLHDDEDLCDRIQKGLERSGRSFAAGSKLRGVPPKKGTVDRHRMKTLCRELRQLLDEGHVKMAKGVEPSMGDIERLPGDFLLNPGAVVRNTQPTFEKDFEEWIDRHNRAGG